MKQLMWELRRRSDNALIGTLEVTGVIQETLWYECYFEATDEFFQYKATFDKLAEIIDTREFIDDALEIEEWINAEFVLIGLGSTECYQEAALYINGTRAKVQGLCE